MTVILVVEDDTVTRRLLSHTLGKSGYEVVAVDGAPAGMDALQAHAVDLVICDVQMPEMSGIEFLRFVRADGTYTEVPFVMLTASGEDIYRDEAMAAGANVFLTKPTRSQELRQTVQRLLR